MKLTTKEKIELSIEALKVLTREEDLKEREIIRKELASDLRYSI